MLLVQGEPGGNLESFKSIATRLERNEPLKGHGVVSFCFESPCGAVRIANERFNEPVAAL